MYVCMYVCMHACIYMYVCMYVCIYIYKVYKEPLGNMGPSTSGIRLLERSPRKGCFKGVLRVRYAASLFTGNYGLGIRTEKSFGAYFTFLQLYIGTMRRHA